MLQIRPSQIQPANFRGRFEMMAADAPLSHDFCVFDFPGCKGGPKAPPTVQTVGSSEDPMNSEALRAWLRALPAPKSSFFAPISEIGYGGVHSPAEPHPVQETSRGNAQ